MRKQIYHDSLMLMTCVLFMIYDNCKIRFEYIAVWLRYSRVRDRQLQPLLKNMIKAEKNLGAGCNHNIISRPGHLTTSLISWTQLPALSNSLPVDLEILSSAGLENGITLFLAMLSLAKILKFSVCLKSCFLCYSSNYIGGTKERRIRPPWPMVRHGPKFWPSGFIKKGSYTKIHILIPL